MVHGSEVVRLVHYLCRKTSDGFQRFGHFQFIHRIELPLKHDGSRMAYLHGHFDPTFIDLPGIDRCLPAITKMMNLGHRRVVWSGGGIG